MRILAAAVGIAVVVTLWVPRRADAHPRSEERSEPVRGLPLSLSVTYGAMASDDGELFSAAHVWVGYRYRPIPEPFAPFIAVGVEGTLSGYPFATDEISTGSIAPTLHVGLDYVPRSYSNWPEISIFSVYAIGALIVGPRDAYEQGQRFGGGMTFVPVTLFTLLPNTIELTRDAYTRNGQTEHLWHAKIGWGF